jgi:hypothetical protein
MNRKREDELAGLKGKIKWGEELSVPIPSF